MSVVAVTLPTSLIYHRKAFHLANKETNETVDEWYHRLQDLALTCDYGCYLEMLLLDKLVVGLDEVILDRMCKEQKGLSLKDVIEFSRNYEVNSGHMDIKPEMVIVKQELDLSDFEDDDDGSQSNCDMNYTDESGCTDGQVNKDASIAVKPFVSTQLLVYDRAKPTICNLLLNHTPQTSPVHSEKVSKCHLCGKWLKTPSSLVRHVNMHLNDRTYHCDLCDFSCASAISLKRHIIQHNKSKSSVLKCFQCQEEFISLRHLRLHRTTHENDEDVETMDINFDENPILDESFQVGLTKLKVQLKTFIFQKPLAMGSKIVWHSKFFKVRCCACHKLIKVVAQARGINRNRNWSIQPFERHFRKHLPV